MLNNKQSQPKKQKVTFYDTPKGLLGACPVCHGITIDLSEKDSESYLKCSYCGFESPAKEFDLNHALNDYPLQSIAQVTPADADDFEDDPEPTDLGDVFGFDETLVQQGTAFERLYRHYLRNDIAPQFAFVGALATLAAVIGDRVKIQFADQTLKPNDYFVLLSASGGGKTTSLAPVYSLLQRTERKFTHETGVNLFIYPASSTERALIDVMREATDVEKEKGIKHTPQSSGLLICDEITSLFTEMHQQHSAKLDSIILKLWDGVEMTFATSKRLDGRFTVPKSALTILGASTPLKFRTALPRTAFSDGLLARMNFVHCARRTKPRRAIGELVIQSHPFNDESPALIDELLRLYKFITQANLTPEAITPAAVEADKANVERWFGEQNGFADENEAIDAYFNRISARCWKYSIILATCRAFALNEDKITIDAEIIQHAAKVADYFKRQFIYFVKKGAGNDEKGLDQIGRIKAKIIELLSARFAKGATFRDLLRFTNTAKANLTTAIDELLEVRSVLTVKENYKGREIVRYILPKRVTADKPESNPSYAKKVTTDTTDTTDSPQVIVNKGLESVVTLSVVTQSVVTEKTPPQPPVPEPPADPMPASPLLSLRKSLESMVKAYAQPTPAPAAKPEPLPDPMPASPEPPVPEPLPEPMPAPKPNLSNADLAEIVLDHIRRTQSRKKIQATEIRQVLNSVCGARADEVGRLIYPAHILRLADTDFFILRDDKHRPQGYQGLIPDSRGVLPDANPMPF